ncbi:MAG: hypothetical protein ACI3YK_05855 [Eubacteriales bacterium]
MLKYAKMIALILLHAVFVANSPMIVMGIGFALVNFLPNDFAVFFALLACIVTIILLGIICVDDIKTWLISLPVQYLVSGIAVWKSGGSILVVFLLTLLALMPQAIGVGIKFLYRRRKSKDD